MISSSSLEKEVVIVEGLNLKEIRLKNKACPCLPPIKNYRLSGV